MFHFFSVYARTYVVLFLELYIPCCEGGVGLGFRV